MYLFSNCLYNVALYNVRQHFFKDKTYLSFESNYHECKDNDNYKLMQANMAQQTLRTVDFAFRSFFGALGKVKSARPSRYRKKGGLYNLIITGNSVSIHDGYLEQTPRSSSSHFVKTRLLLVEITFENHFEKK